MMRIINEGGIVKFIKKYGDDIFEQMSDPVQAVEKYSVEFDLGWLPNPPPQPVRIVTLLSADRDINPADIPGLIKKYHAPAADWESGAIAWVAKRNKVPCLILRAVSDLVSSEVSFAYGDYPYFERQCQGIMADFANHLPDWIEVFLE